MDTELQKLIDDFITTLNDKENEEAARKKIEQSQEFKDLQKKIDDLVKDRDYLLSKIPDSSEEFEMDKSSLLNYMNEKGIKHLDGFEIKNRISKSVNTVKVLSALDGDLDQFFTIANVTQKALTEYGKLHPDIKKPLKDAIEIDKVTIVDIVPRIENI